ncbi:TetR/AcrR family transcriptional regulator [Nocardia sp. CA-151230]|uniref:TetR/AcrR family transcriptional regulator n=1 Tax=Nocardia sp. CA-151230 TaxID=3239982 RepID=UPI003D8A633D
MTQEAVGGLRYQKAQRLREELIATALRLFEEQGFEQTTVQQIADAVEVSRRTFHRHFPSKESVIFDHESFLVTGIVAALERRPPHESAITALRGVICEELLASEYAELLQPYVDNVRRVRKLLTANPVLRRANFTGGMERMQALASGFAARAGSPDSDLRPQLAAAGCFAALTVGLDQWTAGRDHSVAGLRTMLDAVLESMQHGPDILAAEQPSKSDSEAPH